MVAEANKQTKKQLSNLNFVHNDEIWKSHIHQEVHSRRYKWPNQWGYLVEEYNALTLKLQDYYEQDPSTESASNVLFPPITTHTKQLSSVLETTSPLIGLEADNPKCSSSNLLFPPIKRHAKMLRSVPETTSQLIGWKIGNGKLSEIHGKSPKLRGRRELLKSLKWPMESQP